MIYDDLVRYLPAEPSVPLEQLQYPLDAVCHDTSDPFALRILDAWAAMQFDRGLVNEAYTLSAKFYSLLRTCPGPGAICFHVWLSFNSERYLDLDIVEVYEEAFGRPGLGLPRALSIFNQGRQVFRILTEAVTGTFFLCPYYSEATVEYCFCVFVSFSILLDSELVYPYSIFPFDAIKDILTANPKKSELKEFEINFTLPFQLDRTSNAYSSDLQKWIRQFYLSSEVPPPLPVSLLISKHTFVQCSFNLILFCSSMPCFTSLWLIAIIFRMSN